MTAPIMGLIKVDLLGLGMMAVLKDSIGLIRDHYNEEIDLAHLPQNCPDVYDTIRKADTIGMFQIESCAQMASLPTQQSREVLRSGHTSCADPPRPDCR